MRKASKTNSVDWAGPIVSAFFTIHHIDLLSDIYHETIESCRTLFVYSNFDGWVPAVAQSKPGIVFVFIIAQRLFNSRQPQETACSESEKAFLAACSKACARRGRLRSDYKHEQAREKMLKTMIFRRVTLSVIALCQLPAFATTVRPERSGAKSKERLGPRKGPIMPRSPRSQGADPYA